MSKAGVLFCLLAASTLGSGIPYQAPFSVRVQKTPSTFFAEVDKELSDLYPSTTEADWGYSTNLTDANQEAATAASLIWNEKFLGYVEESRQYLDSPDLSPDEARLLSILQIDGSNTPTDPAAQAKLSGVVARMTALYSTATVDGRPLTPDLEDLLSTSRDHVALERAYIGFRDATGPKMKADYVEFVKLINQAAQDGGFKNAKDLWLSGYDMPPEEFTKLLEGIWAEQLKPLYEKLHCYVRSKLTEKYGSEVVGTDGRIPGHLLGNIWSQEWTSIYHLVAPYPSIPSTDVTEELQEQGYDAVRMHALSEDFYKSIGFDALPASFWKKSMLVKPTDREAVCHASAWDFGNNDLRIKMCTQINHDELVTIHHEQGHLMYDHAYRNRHFLYRTGAADFFHEAIGDAIALSVVVPRHLRDVGLLPKEEKVSDVADKALINYQMQVALSKIVILPWALLVDKWRWSVFDGTTTPDKYNRDWWNLVEEYQGVKSPVQRPDDGFDAGSKFHIPNNTPYARYYGAAILQFQLHKGLCQTSGHKGPLHDCSIYKSKDAGKQFLKLLSLGRSKPWPQALSEVVKDQANDGKQSKGATLDASSLIKYFEPLTKWLDKANEGKQCGW